MPTYGYRCEQCGHELEVFQSMSDVPLKTCEACGGGLRKLLYPVGVQFKGSGFYTTDYRNGGGGGGKSKSESESGGGSSESSGGSGSSSSSDSNGSSTSTPEKKTESAASKE